MVHAMHGAILAVALAMAPAVALADRERDEGTHRLEDVAVTGAGAGHRLAGKLEIQRFVAVNGSVVAVGLLRGNLRDRAGNAAGFEEEAVAIPLEIPNAAGSQGVRSTRSMGGLRALVVPAQVKTECPVLNLQFAPVDLNLLGLVVNTDPIALTIGANTGPGNVLGNLLCQVLGLLDTFTAASAGALANSLNQVLAAL